MELFSNITKIHNDNIAVIERNDKFSYRKLNIDLKKFDGFFTKRSVILFFGQNTYASLLFYIHCIINRNIPILVDPLIDKKYFNKIIDKYKPDFIYASQDLKLKNPFYTYQGKILNYFILKINKKIYYEIYKDLALLLTTSGSTGSPKLVRLSYDNLFSNTHSSKAL